MWECSSAAGFLETATSLNQEQEAKSGKGKHGHGVVPDAFTVL